VDETGLFQPCLFQDPVDKPGSQILFRMGNSDDTRLCLMNELVVVSPDPVQSRPSASMIAIISFELLFLIVTASSPALSV